MDAWGAALWGDPCRECGFSWAMDAGDARAVVAGMPSTMSAVLTGARGDEQHPDLAWDVTAYVLHVGDNLRIWAERLAGIALGGPTAIAPYDENALAAARNYDGIGLRAALWSLRRGAGDWETAFAMTAPELRLDHPERGDDAVATGDIERDGQTGPSPLADRGAS